MCKFHRAVSIFPNEMAWEIKKGSEMHVVCTIGGEEMLNTLISFSQVAELIFLYQASQKERPDMVPE